MHRVLKVRAFDVVKYIRPTGNSPAGRPTEIPISRPIKVTSKLLFL